MLIFKDKDKLERCKQIAEKLLFQLHEESADNILIAIQASDILHSTMLERYVELNAEQNKKTD